MVYAVRLPSRVGIAVVCAGLAVGGPVLAAGEQAEQFTPEFRQVHTSYDAKHTPKIVAPASVKRGEWFTVTTVVRDSRYLRQPFVTTTHFKKEPDGAKWEPTPCQSVKLTPVFIRNGTTITARKARTPGSRKRA